MTSPPLPLLDFQALLAPIPGKDPAGGSGAFSPFRDAFLEAIREENPAHFAADRRAAQEKFKKADWPGAIQLAVQTLATQSKDLRIAAYLTLALTQTDRFAGLRDGLHLLGWLVAECWDRLHPAPEKRGDGLTKVLDDPEGGARFPVEVRRIPLVESPKGAFGSLHLRPTADTRTEVNGDELKYAIQVTPLEKCEQNEAEIGTCLEELQQLKTNLEARPGPAEAPTFYFLHEALTVCRQCARDLLAMKRPSGTSPDGLGAAQRSLAHPDVQRNGALPGGGSPEQVFALLEQARTRVYQQLEQAAADLERLEPSNPIPYLIRRAAALAGKPFPNFAKSMIRDERVVQELFRELGIPESAAATPKEETK